METVSRTSPYGHRDRWSSMLRWVMVLVVTCGCDGYLTVDGAEEAEPPSRSPAGEEGSRSGAGGNPGDSSGSEGRADDRTERDVPEEGDVKSAPYRVLTNADYVNTIRDVFDVDPSAVIDLPEDEPIAAGLHFLGNTRKRVGRDAARRYAEASRRVVDAIDLERVFGCRPEGESAARACVEQFLADAGERLYRRPVTEAQRARLLAIYESARSEREASWREASRLMIRAMLQSPLFIYHIERGTEEKVEGVVPLTGHEMAARLSYFLWRGPPDRELLEAADEGELATAEGIAGQVERMLGDARLRRTMRAFHEQWLHIGRLDEVTGKKADPQWGESLKWAVRESLARWTARLYREGGTVSRLLTGAEFPVNRRLATLMGIDPSTIASSFEPSRYDEEARRRRAISVNFLGRDDDGEHELIEQAEAGVVARASWNNLSGTSGTVDGLVDDRGESTGAFIDYVGNRGGRIDGRSSFDDPDQRLMHGQLAAYKRSPITVSVGDLPESVTAGGYDLYLYYDAKSGERKNPARTFSFRVNGETKKGYYGQKSFYDLGEQFVEGKPERHGNYVVFRGLDRGRLQIQTYVAREDIPGMWDREEICQKIPNPDQDGSEKSTCCRFTRDGHELDGRLFCNHCGNCYGKVKAHNNRKKAYYNRTRLAGLQIVARRSPARQQYDRMTFEPVEIAERRSGVLTHPAFLAAHAHAGKSSPIFRGVAVLRQMMCQRLPDPPMNLEVPEPSEDATTTREKVASITDSPDCQGCHSRINPIGYGLEHFDAIGRYRERDSGEPVDDSGAIMPGLDWSSPVLGGSVAKESFEGVEQMTEALGRSEAVAKCLALQWYRYAMRMTETTFDQATFDAIYETFRRSDYRLDALLEAIAVSRAFRYKSAE